MNLNNSNLVSVPLKHDQVVRYSDAEAKPGTYLTARLRKGTLVQAKGKIMNSTWLKGPAVHGIARPTMAGGGVHVRAYVPELDAWVIDCVVDAMCA